MAIRTVVSSGNNIAMIGYASAASSPSRNAPQRECQSTVGTRSVYFHMAHVCMEHVDIATLLHLCVKREAGSGFAQPQDSQANARRMPPAATPSLPRPRVLPYGAAFCAAERPQAGPRQWPSVRLQGHDKSPLRWTRVGASCATLQDGRRGMVKNCSGDIAALVCSTRTLHRLRWFADPSAPAMDVMQVHGCHVHGMCGRYRAIRKMRCAMLALGGRSVVSRCDSSKARLTITHCASRDGVALGFGIKRADACRTQKSRSGLGLSLASRSMPCAHGGATKLSFCLSDVHRTARAAAAQAHAASLRSWPERARRWRGGVAH